eukprot:m.874616 g.874616  ORF g.874616 m.874616 type:complete len:55 (-) comp23576_c0_seq14:1176-1340(-)
MFTDVRDAFFQRDPFAAVQHPHDLMVFEEHQDVSTEHWLVVCSFLTHYGWSIPT